MKRHLRSVVYTLAMALIATGCVVQPKPTTQHVTQLDNPLPIVKVEINDVPTVAAEQLPEIAAAVPSELPTTPTVPLSTFTKLELEHVSSSTYNPFPDGKNNFTASLSNGVFPLHNGKFSSGYGTRGRRHHSGSDILNAAGEPIFAVFDGVVRLSKPYSGYGNVVVLRHNNGLETVYSHNSKNLVKAGQVVRAGDKIALVGRTGQATTNHLHFEVRIMGKTINPILVLDMDANTVRPGSLLVKRSGSSIVASNNSQIIDQPTHVQVETGVQAQVQTQTQTQTQTANEKIEVKASTESAPAAVYHTIKKGDTLYGLALKYKTKVASICRLNSGLTAKSTLKLGRKIHIK